MLPVPKTTPSTSATDASLTLQECHDCGLMHRIEPSAEHPVASCRRCHATLRKTRDNSATLACACSAAILFCFVLTEPLLSLRAVGRFCTGSVFTGPSELSRFGMEEVGWLVLLTLVIAPALKLTMLVVALVWERTPETTPKWAPWAYGWLERLGPWAMVEVFLLGTFVAYTRLRAIASVEVGPALVALVGVMLASVAADATIDRHAIWDSFDRTRRAPPAPRGSGSTVACLVCSRVSHVGDGAACPRCAHRVHRRKPNSIPRTWAFLGAAVCLYIPANVFPVMTVTRLGRGGPHTILGGVVELFEDHLWPLALIVLIASALVPIAKLGALAFMLIATHARSRGHLLVRTRIFRVIAVIGRWSMIDIFALTVLCALVRMGFFATVVPGEAAIAFAAVVVLTMLATESFDPRLMWDAADPKGEHRGTIPMSHPAHRAHPAHST